MKMMIYIDVLLVFNLYISYFLIRSTALLLRIRISTKRCLIAAAIGSLSSLLILVPELPATVCVLIKAAICIITVLVAFGKGSKRDVAMRSLVMLTVCFMYSGLMLALWSLASPLGMICSNGVTYFDIPISAIAVLTIICYCAIKLIRHFCDKRVNTCECAVVSITNGGNAVTLRGFADTGNGLCDPFSGRPVIICTAASINGILPENVRKYLSRDVESIEGIRLVPCNTVTAEGLIPIFSAEDISVEKKPVDAVIGVSNGAFNSEFDCIFNPKILT